MGDRINKKSVITALLVVPVVLAAGALLFGSKNSLVAALVSIPIVAVLGTLYSMILRRNPLLANSTGRDGSMPEAATRLTRAVIAAIASAGVLLLTAIVIFSTVAKGEARGHVFMHVILGAVALVVYMAVAMVWRPGPSTDSRTGRAALLMLLWLASAGALLESMGAGGYDRFNDKSRIDWLTALHGAAQPVGIIALVAIPLGVGTLLLLGIGRLRARIRTAGP